VALNDGAGVAKRERVGGFPTLRLYRGGLAREDYGGPHTAAALVAYMLGQLNSSKPAAQAPLALPSLFVADLCDALPAAPPGVSIGRALELLLAARTAGLPGAAPAVALGLGRIVALYCRSSALYQNRQRIRCVYFCSGNATEPQVAPPRGPAADPPAPELRGLASAIAAELPPPPGVARTAAAVIAATEV
jgi:hypothetical protein